MPNPIILWHSLALDLISLQQYSFQIRFQLSPMNCTFRNRKADNIGDITERNIIILLQDAYNISIAPFCCFPFVFFPWIDPLKCFKEVGGERVLNCFPTTLYKGCDFSLENISFGKTKYLCNVNISKVLHYRFGCRKAYYDGGGGRWMFELARCEN